MRTLLFLLTLSAVALPVSAQRQMENLSRGVVAIPNPGGGVFVGWRLFGTDPEGIAFNVYRSADDGPAVKVNDEPLTGATSLVDAKADVTASLSYQIRPVVEAGEVAPGQAVRAWEGDYLEIPIETIEGYRPGDTSVADLDGDGELEIVLHQVSRPRDNGSAGVTGEPILDAYKLNGAHLWRINLGKNIREGEHYTQFMVYDLDGDGRAEVACKTADGTVDGVGEVIGDADKDWRTLQEGSPRDGRILNGPEYFTIFAGDTGAALKTIDYVPGRGAIDGWGGIGGNAGNDSYGNRCDRFLACVAYLDGERPSVVMCRGVYGRIVMAAWDWRDGELSQRWVFDSGSSRPPYSDASPYSGMGGHSLSVGDVDSDGRDEIVYQAMVVDDDGKGLYSTGLRHGDVMHLTDMYPDRPGMEVFTVQENEDDAELFQTPGAAMRDARTGEILWSHSPTVDVPSGMAADIDPTHRGYEAWGGPGGLRNSHGESMGPAPRENAWCIWWDGDPLRELVSPGVDWGRWYRWRLAQASPGGEPTARKEADGAIERALGSREDRDERDTQRRRPDSQRSRMPRRPTPTRVVKWDWVGKKSDTVFECDAMGVSRGPALVGDLLGDWREEMVLVAPDGKSLRLYTTTIETEVRLPTLLHDPQYRLGLAWQNVVYNKPCHPSFYLGDGMSAPTRPKIRLVGAGEAIAIE
ncbi:Rhamnogalacturonan exolyase YesX [Botrimarina colliarenosi]|uniref:Rhamnogalacturonan exolyase YesX n=1 Tax=Botrimarina colliarenosi TaxID=2528001 RepID=A0A5C6AM80_9BACT|nr:rhamnogalacturonan lyase [Botrimarina colliarenosi]TWU00577.1 Rhamnogalacturonan exolyase YesX [Botrimarina colliarenosi]